MGLVGTPLETLRELFADVWMVLVCSPVYYGMYFAVYEPLKRFLSGVLPSGHRSLFPLFPFRPLLCPFKAARPFLTPAGIDDSFQQCAALLHRRHMGHVPLPRPC